MLAAMAQTNEPVGVAGGPDAQAKARKFGIPDAVFARAAAACAAQSCHRAVPGARAFAAWGHMAIGNIKTRFKSCGNPVICGDQMAFSGIPAAEQPQHLTH